MVQSKSMLASVNDEFGSSIMSCVAMRGSHSHGTYVPPEDNFGTDDIDLMCVTVPSVDHYLGLSVWGSRGTNEKWIGHLDVVAYEYKKFVSLLCNGNPNVISMLWLRDCDYLYKDTTFNVLVKNRDLFSTGKVIGAFLGYANAQMVHMEKAVFKGFMGEKRKALVTKFGFDTKHASHLIRLLRMLNEFLDTGRFNVWRHDATNLVDIKCGRVAKDTVLTEARELIFRAESHAMNLGNVPPCVDKTAVNAMIVNALRERFHV